MFFQSLFLVSIKMIIWMLTHQKGTSTFDVLSIFDSFNLGINAMTRIITQFSNSNNVYPIFNPRDPYTGSFTHVFLDNAFKLTSYNITDNLPTIFIDFYYTSDSNQKLDIKVFNGYQDIIKSFLIKDNLQESEISYQYISKVPEHSVTNAFYYKNGIEYLHIIKEYPIIVDKERQQFMLLMDLKDKMNTLKDNISSNINEQNAYQLYCMLLQTKINVNNI